MSEKFIVFSDFHANTFSEFAHSDSVYGNSRFAEQISVLKQVIARAEKDKATILFAGDLFHTRVRVDTLVFNHVYSLIAKTSRPVYMIKGNHDNVTNLIDSPSSLDPFKYLPNVTLIEGVTKVVTSNGTEIVGACYGQEIDYIKSEMSKLNGDIFMGHMGVSGSLGVGSTELEGEFSKKDIVELVDNNYSIGLLGHYHRQQQVTPKTMYVGNTVPMSFSDSDLVKGFYEFDLDDNHEVSNLIFIPQEHAKGFLTIDLDKGMEVTEENSKNNYIRVRGNAEDLNLAKSLDMSEGGMPDTIRLETIKKSSSNNRLDMSDDSDLSPVSFTKAWAKANMPEMEKYLVSEIKEVL